MDPRDAGHLITKPNSKAGNAIQTPPLVFWNHLDSYFVPISDNALEWLRNDDWIKPIHQFLAIPALGVNRERSEQIFRRRLVSSLLEQDGMCVGEELSGVEDCRHYKPDNMAIVPDTMSDDARIRRNLAMMGMVDGETEDDSICQAMKQLQNRLWKVACLNQQRRRMLYDRVVKFLPCQEYYGGMEKLYGHLEQLAAKKYIRQSSIQKKKKRPTIKIKTNVTLDDLLLEYAEKKNFLRDCFSEIVPSREQIQQDLSGTQLFTEQD